MSCSHETSQDLPETYLGQGALECYVVATWPEGYSWRWQVGSNAVFAAVRLLEFGFLNSFMFGEMAILCYYSIICTRIFIYTHQDYSWFSVVIFRFYHIVNHLVLQIATESFGFITVRLRQPIGARNVNIPGMVRAIAPFTHLRLGPKFTDGCWDFWGAVKCLWRLADVAGELSIVCHDTIHQQWWDMECERKKNTSRS